MSVPHALLEIAGFGCLVIAVGYSCPTFFAMGYWQYRRKAGVPEQAAAHSRLPITVLKPLCGAEPGLYEHLRGFCVQDYPDFQIVFGLSDPADPARIVVERLMHEFPALAIDLVVDPRQHGTNRKVSNLINMLHLARHDLLVMADSDAFVGADYLLAVTAPLLDSAVGLVTCTYTSIPTELLWSRLGAMYINEWYVPSVQFAWLFGYEGYVSGQTLCTRQTTLNSIGGLRAIADHLADDHRLGELVRARGLHIVLSPYQVRGIHHEPSFDSLLRHETRWLRTIRILRPRSFSMIFLTFSLPLAALGLGLALLSQRSPRIAWALFALAAAVRLGMHLLPRIGEPRLLLADLWLLPIRDLLLCGTWCRSFFTSRVTWRGSEFDVDADGFMHTMTKQH